MVLQVCCTLDEASVKMRVAAVARNRCRGKVNVVYCLIGGDR